METAPFPAMAAGLPGAGGIPGQLYRDGKQQETSQAVLALDTSSSEHPTPRHLWKEAVLESLGSRPQISSSAPRATGLSKTVAFEGQKGGEAANRGNKQLIWDLSRVQREEKQGSLEGGLCWRLGTTRAVVLPLLGLQKCPCCVT